MAEGRDADGDSQMGNASMASSDSDEDMFPTSSNAEVGAASSSHVTSRAGDLSSPPASQAAIETVNGTASTAMETSEESAPALGTEDERRFASAAGASWNTKKARDEWQRAWNAIEDKQFSLAEFGDPFDEKVAVAST